MSFPVLGKIKLRSVLDILSLKYVYTIQVEILKSIKEYGSIIHKKKFDLVVLMVQHVIEALGLY